MSDSVSQSTSQSHSHSDSQGTFLKRLLDDATQPFLGGGRFAYHYARGKLGGDPIFRELLRQGLLIIVGDTLRNRWRKQLLY